MLPGLVGVPWAERGMREMGVAKLAAATDLERSLVKKRAKHV